MSKEQDKKTTFIAVGAAALIVIIGMGTAVYALTLESDKPAAEEHSSETAHTHADGEEHSHSHGSDSKVAAAPSGQQASLTIVYTDDGFEDNSYTVKSGETVLVKNNSNVEFYFTTGDHHNHDINSALNLGTIAPGESSSFVAPAAGTYGFHNHDDEHQAGELIVQ